MIQESAPRLYQEFWAEFNRYCLQPGTTLQLPSSCSRKFLQFAIGKTGFAVCLDTARQSSQVECVLWISGVKAERAFSKLKTHEHKITARLGKKVQFGPSPGGRAFKAFESKDCDLYDRKAWPSAHEWLKDHAEAYVAVFTPIVKDL